MEQLTEARYQIAWLVGYSAKVDQALMAGHWIISSE